MALLGVNVTSVDIVKTHRGMENGRSTGC
jgi:hypothetical protein